jgi:hypothetical protein
MALATQLDRIEAKVAASITPALKRFWLDGTKGYSPDHLGSSLAKILRQRIIDVGSLCVTFAFAGDIKTQVEVKAKRTKLATDVARIIRLKALRRSETISINQVFALKQKIAAMRQVDKSQEEIAAYIRENVYSIVRPYAATIARTEVNSAYNEARQARFNESGYTHKAWVNSGDDKVRHAHLVGIGYIPIDEPFNVGGEDMLYPLDDSLGASAGNIINCRCRLKYKRIVND